MRRTVICRTICLAILIGFGRTPAHADTVTVPISPSKDNTLYEDLQGALSNGAGSRLFVGKITQGDIFRGLIAFDIAGAIPQGALITRVTLKLNMSKTVSGPQPITLHKLLADWGEGASHASDAAGGMGAPSAPGDATWIHRFFPGSSWGTPGGDFAPKASASKMVDQTGAYTWASTPRMVADVQTWLDRPATNFGWLLQGNEATNGTAKRFDTKESVVTDRPVLTVQFTPRCDGQEATIIGTIKDDILVGTPGDDVIVGWNGNDVIHGLGGDDSICGGAGDDVLFGDGGADRLFGEAGSDVLHGGAGADRLAGGDGPDVLLGEDDDDVLLGGDGEDSLHGGAGADQLLGGRGNDTLKGGADNDELNGGPGSDVCDGGGDDADTDTGGCEISPNIP